jgi:hypothetical protein
VYLNVADDLIFFNIQNRTMNVFIACVYLDVPIIFFKEQIFFLRGGGLYVLVRVFNPYVRLSSKVLCK